MHSEFCLIFETFVIILFVTVLFSLLNIISDVFGRPVQLQEHGCDVACHVGANLIQNSVGMDRTTLRDKSCTISIIKLSVLGGFRDYG